jgi:hypothetical protein
VVIRVCRKHPAAPVYSTPNWTADKPGVFYFLDFGGEERGRVHDESESE